MLRWRASFFAGDEASTDPDTGCAVATSYLLVVCYHHQVDGIRERCCKTTAVGDTSCCNDNDGLSSQWANCVLADIDACRDEDGERCVASVATALATLRTNDIDTCNSRS